MSTCNRLHLESLGSWLTIPKNFPPGHCSGLTSIHGTSIPECRFLAAYLKLCTIAKKFITFGVCYSQSTAFPNQTLHAQGPGFFSEGTNNGQRPVVLDLVTGKLPEFQALSERLKEITYCRHPKQLDELRKYGWHVLSWDTKIRLLGGRRGKFDEDLHACSDIVTKEYNATCCEDLNCKDLKTHIMLIHDMCTKNTAQYHFHSQAQTRRNTLTRRRRRR